MMSRAEPGRPDVVTVEVGGPGAGVVSGEASETASGGNKLASA